MFYQILNIFNSVVVPTTEETGNDYNNIIPHITTFRTFAGTVMWNILSSCIEVMQIKIQCFDVQYSLWQVMIIGMLLSLGGWMLWRFLHPFDDD